MNVIALDMMGGDFAPEQAVKGVANYLSNKTTTSHLLLIGQKPMLEALLAAEEIDEKAYTIYHAEEVIGMDEHPTKALKEKPGSSIAKGFKLLCSGEAQAFISAGNTGAMMVGALFSIKTIPGILRPTIGAYMPKENGSIGLLADVGLNADSKPENLNQFATMASLFAEHILEIPFPKVGLINIGEEEGKGNLLAQAVYPLLKENAQINFVGNIEGRDILMDDADVMICEGFTGNVILKMAESLYDLAKMRDIKDEYFQRFNFETYGGVPVLGVSRPVIIGHGISGGLAFSNMIQTAERMLEKDLCGKIEEAFCPPTPQGGILPQT